MEKTLGDDPLNDAIEQIDAAWDGTVKKGHYTSPEGDCVFVYNEAAPYYRERVDGVLTVFRAIVGGRIIGLQVKGLSALPSHDALNVTVSTADGLPRQDIVVLLLLNLQSKPAEAPEAAVELARVYAQAFDMLREVPATAEETVEAV